MGTRGECGFVDRFQNHPQGFLHQFVGKGGDSQRTLLFAVLLFDVGTAGRFGSVGFFFQGLDNPFHFFFAKTVRCVIIHSFCGGPFVGVQVFVGCKVQVGPEQITVKPCEDLVWMVP